MAKRYWFEGEYRTAYMIAKMKNKDREELTKKLKNGLSPQLAVMLTGRAKA